MELNLQEIISR